MALATRLENLGTETAFAVSLAAAMNFSTSARSRCETLRLGMPIT